MGRTKPTYRRTVQQRRDEWQPMQRYMRKHLQEHYDELWDYANEYADVAGQANPVNPMMGILMSMCLGQQIEIAQLETRVAELEDWFEHEHGGTPK